MTIADNLKAGRPTQYLLLAVAAWMKFVRRVAADNSEHVDPLKSELFAIAAQCNGDAKNDVGRFLTLRQMFTEDLTTLPGFTDGLVAAYTTIGNTEVADIYAAIDSNS
jgi:fructuronate reductase